MSTSQTQRPLSPHLQVYKPQLTSVLSITHRITGIVLAFGIFLLSAWLFALANGPEAFNTMHGLLASIPGRIVLFVFTLALYFHLCNGIRHLFWDAGYGFELKTVYASGKATIALSIVLTLVTWALAYAWR